MDGIETESVLLHACQCHPSLMEEQQWGEVQTHSIGVLGLLIGSDEQEDARADLPLCSGQGRPLEDVGHAGPLLLAALDELPHGRCGFPVRHPDVSLPCSKAPPPIRQQRGQRSRVCGEQKRQSGERGLADNLPLWPLSREQPSAR